MFIGRERELAEFRRLARKPTASLIVCQGRRRIGKSTFFRECAKTVGHFLNFEGLAPRANLRPADQLEAFAQALARQTRIPAVKLESWPQALQLLASAIPSDGKTLVLLDEISCMGMGTPDFADHLKVAWDQWFSPNPRLIVALCGSVSSWIQDNILNNTGFVGRCSWQLTLPPLSLPECDRFWRNRTVTTAEKLRILSVTGGVPRYLEEIDIAQSAQQNLERLCFSPGGMLFNEFDQIFHDIFSRRAETYRDIADTLVGGAKSISEISNALELGRGGTLVAALADLESAGFVRRDESFDPASGDSRPKQIIFRLQDNYMRFYLRYIRPVRQQVIKGLYQHAPLETLQAWSTIMGLQLEALVLGDLPTLLRVAGLENTPILNAGPYFQSRTQRRQGCQVDLLLRSKSSVYVFEIKFRDKISPKVVSEVKEKVAALALDRRTTVRAGLIYAGTLDPEIARLDFFEHLIPFDRLLAP